MQSLPWAICAFFYPYADIRFTANRLPHWQQEGVVYFVTFRLADAIPHKVRTQWESEREAWLRLHLEPWTAEVEHKCHERFSGAIERWLDGSQALAFCADVIVVRLWPFHCTTSMVIAQRLFHLS